MNFTFLTEAFGDGLKVRLFRHVGSWPRASCCPSVGQFTRTGDKPGHLRGRTPLGGSPPPWLQGVPATETKAAELAVCGVRSAQGAEDGSHGSPGYGTDRRKRGNGVSRLHQLGSLPPSLQPCAQRSVPPVSGPRRALGTTPDAGGGGAGEFPPKLGAVSRRMGSGCWGVGLGSDQHLVSFSVCRSPPRRLLPQPGSCVPSGTCPPGGSQSPVLGETI